MAGLGVKHLGWLGAEVVDARHGNSSMVAAGAPPPAEPGVPNMLLSCRERCRDLQHLIRPSSKQELGSAAPWAKQPKAQPNTTQQPSPTQPSCPTQHNPVAQPNTTQRHNPTQPNSPTQQNPTAQPNPIQRLNPTQPNPTQRHPTHSLHTLQFCGRRRSSCFVRL